MKLYFCDIVKEKEKLDGFFENLSDGEKASLSSLPEHRRYEKLAGLMLLKSAAVEQGIFDFTLGKGEFGKPFIEGRPDFQFNLSHSGKYALLACDRLPIGVDIEKIREIDLSITRKFATEREKRYIRSAKEFFEIWVLKEAYIKAIGEGMHFPLRNVEFELRENEILCSDREYECKLNRIGDYVYAAVRRKTDA